MAPLPHPRPHFRVSRLSMRCTEDMGQVSQPSSLFDGLDVGAHVLEDLVEGIDDAKGLEGLGQELLQW